VPFPPPSAVTPHGPFSRGKSTRVPMTSNATIITQGMQQSPNTFGGVSPQGGKPKEMIEVRPSAAHSHPHCGVLAAFVRTLVP
jgi:hypothetical protein